MIVLDAVVGVCTGYHDTITVRSQAYLRSERFIHGVEELHYRPRLFLRLGRLTGVVGGVVVFTRYCGRGGFNQG